jgi:hypothetical protein
MDLDSNLNTMELEKPETSHSNQSGHIEDDIMKNH